MKKILANLLLDGYNESNIKLEEDAAMRLAKRYASLRSRFPIFTACRTVAGTRSVDLGAAFS